MVFDGRLMGFIATRDATRARAFYEGVLGMQFLRDDGFALVMEANEATVRVVRVGEFTPFRFTVLGWEVRGIAEVVKALRSAGVTMEHFGFPGQDEQGVWTSPDGSRVAWFKDPDGNVLSVSEHAA